jgi:hypothetical protein
MDQDVPEPALNSGSSVDVFYFPAELENMSMKRALDIADSMLRRMENGGRIEIADVAIVLKFLRLFGHEYHQAITEIEDDLRSRRGMDFFRNSRRLIARLQEVAAFEENRSPVEIPADLSRLERKYLPSPERALAQSQRASR